MLAATFLLTVPLTFRAIFNFIKIVSPEFYNYILEDPGRNALYNFFFFVFSTYLPIIGQITSLVFGFVRHRQQQNLRKEGKFAHKSAAQRQADNELF